MGEQNTCKHCGQVLIGDQSCDCSGARRQREREREISSVQAELLEVLSTDLVEEGEMPGERLSSLLFDLIPLMVQEGVDRISMTGGSFGKLSISYNGTSWKIKKERGVSIERKV